METGSLVKNSYLYLRMDSFHTTPAGLSNLEYLSNLNKNTHSNAKSLHSNFRCVSSSFISGARDAMTM